VVISALSAGYAPEGKGRSDAHVHGTPFRFQGMLGQFIGETAMRWATTAAAVEAAATSLILLLSPALFGRLILGAELSETGEALGRLTGIALLGFALTCWPKPATQSTLAMFTYNLLASLYLLSGYRGNVRGYAVVAGSCSALAFDGPAGS
jgi:hypothetical protein